MIEPCFDSSRFLSDGSPVNYVLRRITARGRLVTEARTVVFGISFHFYISTRIQRVLKRYDIDLAINFENMASFLAIPS